MRNLSHLNKYFWKYRGRLFMGFLFILLANIFNVYAPKLIGDGIDFLAESLKAKKIIDGGQSTTLSAPESIRDFNYLIGSDQNTITLTGDNFYDEIIYIAFVLSIGYIIFYIIKGIFLFFQRQTIIVMSRYIEYELKNEIYDQYQRLDMSFYKKNRTGDLMNRISEDVSRVRMYIGPAVMYTINLVILVVMCVMVMWKIDAELTLYTLSPLPFMMIAIFYVSTVINKRTEKVQSQQSKLSTMVQETISGIRVLKAFNREKYYEGVFEDESNDYKKKQLDLIKTDSLFMPVIALLVGLSTILTIYIGSNKVIAGELSYGVIVQFVFYVNQLTWPFASVGWVTSLVQKAEASQERINEFLKTAPEIVNTQPNEHSVAGEIEFKNVSFTYPETGVNALRDISFKVHKGEKLAIVGRTGSGKSTIAQLILRLFDTTEGEIIVDQKNIKENHLSSLRKSIGFVPQEVFLFSDTIRNNVAFGTENLSEEAMIQATKDADVYHNITDFPGGFDTLLGERGINLSGGQKQRVSIARAIAKNPSVLIFDDCLSAVDTETEENILQALNRIMAGKTSIIIAHRLSSVKNADRIIVLERGKIVEEGKHDQLVMNGGLYARMYEQQLRSNEPDQGAQGEP
ncbi:MAG: ABC transporter ATP-binding protein [Flavobacteriales bacterium]